MDDANCYSILNNIDRSLIEEDVVKLNMSKRLPIIVVIDSASRFCDQACNIEQSINRLLDYIYQDRRLANSVEFSIISDNYETGTFRKLCEIKNGKQEYLDMRFQFHRTPSGGNIGRALKAAISQIEGRKKVYHESCPKLRYYRPVIFLMTDGIENNSNHLTSEDEDLAFAMEYIHRNVMVNSLAVFALTQNDNSNRAVLQELTGLRTENHIERIEDEHTLTYTFKIVESIIYGGHPVNTKI